jgi:hypothetical protein
MNAHERELLKLINSREFDTDEFYSHVDQLLVVENPKFNDREREAQ